MLDNVLAKTVFGRKLKQTMTLSDAMELLDSMNMFDHGELAEQAISRKSGVARCTHNCPDIDLVTEKQIKHVRVMKSASCDYYRAYISIKTTAPILSVVTNPVTRKQYYFYIPPRAFKHLTGSCISIGFGLDGKSPGSSQWWQYQVKDFATLCELAK